MVRMRRVDASGPVGFGKSEVSQAGVWLGRREEEDEEVREVGGSASRALRIWRASASAFWAEGGVSCSISQGEEEYTLSSFLV